MKTSGNFRIGHTSSKACVKKYVPARTWRPDLKNQHDDFNFFFTLISTLIMSHFQIFIAKYRTNNDLSVYFEA